MKSQDTEDVLSIINLAATCEMYEKGDFENNRATGVCLNNIANLHLKNRKYYSAEINFRQAIERGYRMREKAKDRYQ